MSSFGSKYHCFTLYHSVSLGFLHPFLVNITVLAVLLILAKRVWVQCASFWPQPNRRGK